MRKGSLSIDLSNFVEKTKKELEALKRGVALSLFSSIVRATPVDTGRLRGNWQTNIGSPIADTIEREDPSGASVLREIETKTKELKLGQTIYMRNNLPYAYRIEYEGWSHTKAPEGMVRNNIARIHSLIEERARKGKL